MWGQRVRAGAGCGAWVVGFAALFLLWDSRLPWACACLAVLVAALALLPLLALASQARTRAWAAPLLGRALGFALLSTPLLLLGQHVWQLRYRWFARQWQPLVAALERCELERGHAPRALSELVPNYLPELPSSAVSAGLQLRPLEHGTGAQHHWFDLGPTQRVGRRGWWQCFEGDPEHAL